MYYIIDENNNSISKNAKIGLGSISTNIPYTLSLYVISNTELPLSVESKYFKILESFDIDHNNSPVFKSRVKIAPRKIEELYIFPIHVLYENTVEQKFQDIITITTDLKEFTSKLEIYGEFVVEDERLQILLNNMGKELNLDWYKAFATTDELNDINYADKRFLNEKRRQLLLDFLNLTQLKGSYNSVKNGLSFFGYAGIIELVEYWKHKDGSSDPYSPYGQWSVFDDNSKVDTNEYYKSYYVGLKYSINYQDPDDKFDDNGIPNMLERYVWDDYMFVKLNILKDVLEKYFLPDDIKILDIIGEHTSYAIYSLNVWVNELQIFKYNCEKAWENIEIEQVNPSEQYIQERKLILDLQVYALSQESPGIKFISKAEPSKLIYRVFKDENELEGDLRDYELAMGFWRGDCAVIGVKPLKLIDEYYYGIALLQKISNGYSQLYYSGKKNYTELKDNLRFAIRQAGEYKIVFYVFDLYGSCWEKDFDYVCKFPSFIPAIQFYRPEYSDVKDLGKIRRGIFFDDAIDTTLITAELFAFDLSTQDYDVNNPNFGEENPNTIRRKYKGNEISPYGLQDFVLSKLRKIELGKLNQVPLCEYSDGYEVVMLELPEFPNIFKLQLFESDETYIEADSFINFVSKINTLPEDNIWRKYYTFSIQQVVFRDKNGKLEAVLKNMLILHAVKRGTDFSKFIFKTVESYKEDDDIFASTILKKKIIETNPMQLFPVQTWSIFPYFSLGPALRFFEDECENIKPEDASDILSIDIGLKHYEFVCKSFLEIANELINHVPEVFATYHNGVLAINSLTYGSDLSINHWIIGRNYEHFRQSPIQYLRKTTKGFVYEPGTYIFAGVDLEWKFDNYDIEWHIYEHFSQKNVFTCSNSLLKCCLLNSGIYDVEVKLIDKRTLEPMQNKLSGAIVIK